MESVTIAGSVTWLRTAVGTELHLGTATPDLCVGLFLFLQEGSQSPVDLVQGQTLQDPGIVTEQQRLKSIPAASMGISIDRTGKGSNPGSGATGCQEQHP